MDIGTISRRYAIALYKYACKHKKEKHIYAETLTLSKNYMQYPALRRTVSNPILSKEKKEELLRLAAGENISNQFITFLKLVISQKREALLQIICFGYQAIYRYDKKLMHLYISTAIPISKHIETQIVEKFEQLTHETADVETTVDASIIGGYIIRWDTYRWDAGVATRLRQIKKELSNAVKTN